VTEGPIADLAYLRLRIGDADYLVANGGGGGSPVLLLHGFPQTHFCWRRIAPLLARRYTVVAPDLRGYGASAAPPGGPRGAGYRKREMASELVDLMAELGFDGFVVVGQ
jgi:haloacetate dehalogenase